MKTSRFERRIDVLMTSILTLAVAASIAELIPARWAASTNPAQALRTE